MNRFKFSIFIGLFFIGLLSSCEKDEPTSSGGSSTTVAEDKQNIKATFDNTLVCFEQLKDGDFFQAIMNFLQLQNGNVINENWVSNMFDEMDNVVDLEWVDENNRFSLAQYSGNYTWNHSSETWGKTNSSQIVINFPSDKNKTSNNCTFTVSEYQDESFTVDNEKVYLPKSLKAKLLKDGVEMFNINMSCTYNSSGFPMPIDATISILLNPQTYTFKIKRLTNTQFELSASLNSAAGCSSKFSTKISLANSDYQNLDLDDDINNIQFDYSKDDININGVWDVKTFNSISNPKTEDINNTINFVVKYKQQKIGDLKFKDLGNQRELFIFYKDQSSENTALYYDVFFSDFKSIFQQYFDVDDLDLDI
ncbi:MAG: hypothetical protein RLZZ414_759 [Bacteroidota bacterium]|jgi:hypothetical protein